MMVVCFLQATRWGPQNNNTRVLGRTWTKWNALKSKPISAPSLTTLTRGISNDYESEAQKGDDARAIFQGVAQARLVHESTKVCAPLFWGSAGVPGVCGS